MKLKTILIIICSYSFTAYTQPAAKKIEKELQSHIAFLADDKLEGRRTGSPGEKLAYEYIRKEFKKAGLKPVKYNDYIQPFEIKEGKKIVFSSLSVNGQPLKLNEDFFPLAWSGNGNIDSAGYILYDIASLIADNPHADINEIVYNVAKAHSTIDAVVIVNSSGVSDGMKFNAGDKYPSLTFPVVYIKQNETVLNHLRNSGVVNIKVQLEANARTGHNVIGYLDNRAAHTIVIGAHYDHLGYGEDNNSLFAGSKAEIHNGADDNASGTAALILLAEMLKKSKFKNNNYLFVAFSGEELGLFGSKYFTDNSPVSISDINYMINMDMLGRLNDSTHGLTIGGYGTSSVWNNIITPAHNYFKIKIDSSGSGPSDHTSFYRKNIPVLFFFTGTHKDYHKPGDDADKINYKGEAEIIRYIYHVVASANNYGKLDFIKTKEAVAAAKSSFKVTLGIMPDYTFSGNGVLADGVTEGRPAHKAGMMAGDIIYQLGDHKVSDVQTYMQALNKFEKDESTKVYIRRNNKEMILEITF